MLQTLSILLSIAGLIACPYNCMSVPKTDLAAAAVTCGCGEASCGQRVDPSRQTSSEQSIPSDCDGCCPCTCEAALDKTPSCPSIELVTDFGSPACDLYDTLPHCAASANVSANADHFAVQPAIIFGRALRLQIDSLLL